MMDDDNEYYARVAKEVYAAIISASRGEADVAVVRSGPAFDALIMVAAMLVARSPGFDSADLVRSFSEKAARNLSRQIAAARHNPDAAAAFGQAVSPKDFN